MTMRLVPGTDLNLEKHEWRYSTGAPGDQRLRATVQRARIGLGRRFDGRFWPAVQVTDEVWIFVRLSA